MNIKKKLLKMNRLKRYRPVFAGTAGLMLPVVAKKNIWTVRSLKYLVQYFF